MRSSTSLAPMHRSLPTCCVLLFFIALGMGGCAGSAPSVPDNDPAGMPSYDTDALEQAIHDRINEVRMRNGHSSLAWSSALASLSRTHSQDMAERGFFSHTNPDGDRPADRAREAGLTCSSVVEDVVDDPSSAGGVGENIFNASAYSSRRVTQRGDEETVSYDWNTEDQLVDTIVDGWMDSEGHRQNILRDSYQAQGLGVSVSDEKRVLVTQTFC